MNKAIIHSLPLSEELTIHLCGSAGFSKLDLHQGNLQVPVHPVSRHLTTFVIHTVYAALSNHCLFHQLLKKEKPWSWTSACLEAVHTLKAQLTILPVLAHFDPSSPTLVTINTSAKAVRSSRRYRMELSGLLLLPLVP